MKPVYTRLLLAVGVAVASLVLNFLVFVLSYKGLATPYLNEEQRVENAFDVLSTTLLSFGLVACFIGAIVYVLLANNARQK